MFRVLRKEDEMNYLITGAIRNIGSLVVERLIAIGERPRVLVRSKEKALQHFGDRVEVIVGDLADATTYTPAFRGSDTVLFLTCGQDLAQQDHAAAEAARRGRVGHLVKLFSYDATRKMLGQECGTRGERLPSGLAECLSLCSAFRIHVKCAVLGEDDQGRRRRSNGYRRWKDSLHPSARHCRFRLRGTDVQRSHRYIAANHLA